VSAPADAAERRRARALARVVAGVALLAYANAVPNGFAFDDTEQILNNPWLTDIRYLGRIFTSNVWAFLPGQVSNYYRPLMHAVYLVLYQLFGPRPWPYHLLNVLLHAANSALVFVIVNRLLRRQEGEPAAAATGIKRSEFAALASGVLFAVHTIHTEAVAWVAGLPEVAYTFLLLIVFSWHIREEEPSPRLSAASGGAFFAALLFKETALVLLPLLAAYDVLWGRPAARRDQLRRYLPLAVAFVAFLVLRTTSLGGLGGMQPLKPYGILPVPAYAANVLFFLVLYLAKLFVPADLNAVHVFPILDSLLDVRAMLGAAAVAGFVVAVGATWRRAPRICFALLFTLLPMLPVALVPAYSHTPFGERYLYLPSVGLSLLVAVGMAALETRKRWMTAAFGAAFVIVASTLTVGTILRNRIWRNDLTLFSDVVAKSPESEIGNGNLGRALMAAGRYDEAVGRFRKAVQVNPESVKGRYHLGSALAKAGRPEEAVVEFEALLKAGFAVDTAGQLAEAYAATGRFDSAIATREQIVAALPNSPAEHNLLGIDLARASRYEEAIRQFETAANLDPAEPAYRRNLDRARDRIRR
jgi:protein O-mannosyl-transferase